MKYWQKDSWQRVTKQNTPHLYVYTWIRFCLWLFLIINSLLMIFISKKNSILDEMFPRENVIFWGNILLGVLGISLPFSTRKTDRTLLHVIIDFIIVSAYSWLYTRGNDNIIYIYLLEVAIIIYYAIKIHKDDQVVDNCKIISWWKKKEQARIERATKKIIEKKQSINSGRTENQKIKKMSRKQRKQYLKNGGKT